jgi:hypothetical protein
VEGAFFSRPLVAAKRGSHLAAQRSDEQIGASVGSAASDGGVDETPLSTSSTGDAARPAHGASRSSIGGSGGSEAAARDRSGARASAGGDSLVITTASVHWADAPQEQQSPNVGQWPLSAPRAPLKASGLSMRAVASEAFFDDCSPTSVMGRRQGSERFNIEQAL